MTADALSAETILESPVNISEYSHFSVDLDLN